MYPRQVRVPCRGSSSSTAITGLGRKMNCKTWEYSAWMESRPDLDAKRIAVWGDSPAQANPMHMLFDEAPNWQMGPQIEQQAEPLGGCWQCSRTSTKIRYAHRRSGWADWVLFRARRPFRLCPRRHDRSRHSRMRGHRRSNRGASPPAHLVTRACRREKSLGARSGTGAPDLGVAERFVLVRANSSSL